MTAKNIFEDKIILITGGVGSIGSEIVRQILKFNPKQVRILDIRETEEFFLQQELAKYDNVRFLIGDVREEERLVRAMDNVDIVFHAAALKHVPLCEYNPIEAVKTNVLGTQNVISAAIKNGVGKVIEISTDKAVNPINTMGATKLLAEKLISSAEYSKGKDKPIFCSVRFGNVLGSNGSVIDLFKKQIEKQNELTVTNRKMTRFIMSISEAVSLVLKTVKIMKGGEVFILKMPSCTLGDLVDILIEEYSVKGKKINVKIIGPRIGEKNHEDLMSNDEAKCAVEAKDLFIIPHFTDSETGFYKNAKRVLVQSYNSSESRILTKNELKQFLKREKLI